MRAVDRAKDQETVRRNLSIVPSRSRLSVGERRSIFWSRRTKLPVGSQAVLASGSEGLEWRGEQ